MNRKNLTEAELQELLLRMKKKLHLRRQERQADQQPVGPSDKGKETW